MTGFDPGLLTGGPDKDWPSADFRWGPAGVTLRSNGPDVLTWARQCFTAVPGQPDQAAGELERAVVVVHDELARKLAACCTKPLPGGERLQVECGEGEGMALVRVTALVTPAHRAKRSWPLVLVFAQAPGSDLYAFTTSDPQGSRAGEILVRQILDRQLHRRDATLLHAAGVVLDGRALLFLGDAGWGKTTLATWGTVVQGGQFLAGDRVAAYLDGDVPIAVSYARSARYGAGTLRALLGTDDWLDRLPVPGLNQLMGVPKDGKVDRGEFKVVLNNAELAGLLGMPSAASAPLAGIVVLARPHPDAGELDVAVVPPAEAGAVVRPHLRQSVDMLPPLDWEGRRAYGASDSQLARLTQRVPVILARWRLGREDPAELFGAVQERLKEAGTKPAG